MTTVDIVPARPRCNIPAVRNQIATRLKAFLRSVNSLRLHLTLNLNTRLNTGIARGWSNGDSLVPYCIDRRALLIDTLADDIHQGTCLLAISITCPIIATSARVQLVTVGCALDFRPLERPSRVRAIGECEFHKVYLFGEARLNRVGPIYAEGVIWASGSLGKIAFRVRHVRGSALRR